MRRLLLILLLSGCAGGVAPTDDDDSAGSVEVPANMVEAVCGADVLPASAENTLPSTPLPGASLDCTGAGCTLALPAEVQTRSYGPLRAAERSLVVGGWESDELILARPDGVELLDRGDLFSFAVDDESLWLVEGEQLLQVGAAGAIRRRCGLPDEGGGWDYRVEAAGGELFAFGQRAEVPRARMWRATLSGWEEVPVEVAPDRAVAHDGETFFLLGYGYYHTYSPDSGTVEQWGGSDDDFSAVAVCADRSYWIGGMTGMTLYCSPEHACGERLDHYPFQSASTWCNAEGELEFLTNEDGDVSVLRADNVLETRTRPTGLRLFTSDQGRRYEVITAGDR